MNSSTPTTPKPPSPLKILLMGPPGSRKTTLGLQFPGVHVLDCDRNLDGPDRFIRSSLNKELSYTYDSIRQDDKGSEIPIEDCYNRVCDKLKMFKTDPSYRERNTVFLDSLSHVNEFIIRHVLRMQGKTSRVGEMEARDWSPFKSAAYVLLVSRLEETGKTILCSCHENKVYDAPSKENMMNPSVKEYEPMFQGKIGESLGAFFTDVWRLQVELGGAGKQETWLYTDKMSKCDMLKNSVGMPAKLDITKGFSVLEPYLKGRI